MKEKTENLTQRLGFRLKASREKARMTQRQLADHLQITQPTYSQYESGTRLPSLEIFAEITMVLGVSADFLLGGIDREEVRLDEETVKVFSEFKELHQRNKALFLDLLALLKKHE